MPQTAIIIGATGVTGQLLLHKLINEDTFSKIIIYQRNLLQHTHSKIEQRPISEIYQEEALIHFQADVVFCCVGTTLQKTPDLEAYKAIDYGIPLQIAKNCAANKIAKLLVISALGANEKSKVFYNRTKGEMEVAVNRLGLEKVHFLQPSLIDSDRAEKRTGERIGIAIMRVLNPLFIGKLKKYRSVPAQYIADAMYWLALHPYNNTVIASDEIVKLAKKIS